MAKVKGVIPIVGTIEGINFYYRKGELIARKAGGGFNAKAIKTSPKMKKVRQQNQEFARCSAVNREFKKALQIPLDGYQDGTLHSRLMALFLKIKTLDAVNPRGERTVAQGLSTSYGEKLLKDFVLTPQKSTLLPAQMSFDWNTFSFNITGFGLEWVKFPSQAHFMKVSIYLANFDFNSLEYGLYAQDAININREYLGDSIRMNLAGSLPTTGLNFAIARVCFYQKINDKPFLISSEGTIGVQIIAVQD